MTKINETNHLEQDNIEQDNFIIEGDSMKGCGLKNGMFVKINRNKPVTDKSIIVVTINGKLFVKEYRLINGKVEFHSKNKNYENIKEYKNYEIIGVVESFFNGK